MKTKRLLSVLMAALMVLSAVSVSFSAFGAEDSALQKLKEEILSADALSDDLAARFKALSDKEKDELGIECINKLYGWAYNAASGTVTEKAKASQEALGTYTQNMQKAIEASKQFNLNYGYFTVKDSAGKDTPAPLHPQFSFSGDYQWYPPETFGLSEELYIITPDMQNQVMKAALSAYSALDDIIKEYMIGISDNLVFEGRITAANAAQRLAYMNSGRGGQAINMNFDKEKPAEPAYPEWYSTFLKKYKSVSGSVGMASWFGWDFVISTVAAEYPELDTREKIEAFLDTKSEQDAELEKWKKADASYQQYLIDLAQWEKEQTLFFTEKTKEFMVYLKEVTDLYSQRSQQALEEIYDIIDSYRSYRLGNIELETLVTQYNKTVKNFDAFENTYVLNILSSGNYFWEDGAWRTITYAVEQVKSLSNMEGYQAFIKFLQDFDTSTIPSNPELSFNETITDVRGRYSAVDKNLIKNFQKDYPEEYALYKQIDGLWRFNYPTDRIAAEHDTKGYTSVTVEADTSRNLVNLLKDVIPNVGTGLGGVLGLLTGNTINGVSDNTKIYTSYSLNTVLKTLYPMLATFDVGIKLSFPPSEIGKLTEGYPAATEALNNAATWADLPDNTDWGIAPGDEDAFFAALTASLRPISNLTLFANLLTNSHTLESYTPGKTQGNFAYGLYEQVIIPLLELLGVENVMDSDTYTKEVKKGTNDTQLTLIFNQLRPVLHNLLNNPLDTLVSILPNIMYHLNEGCINIDLNVMGLANLNITLNWEMIAGLLDGLLAGTGVNLEDLQLTALAYMGTPKEVSTAAANGDKTVFIQADKTSVYNYILNTADLLLSDLGVVNMGTLKTNFVKQEAPSYPHNGKMGKDVMDAMINGLDGLIGGLVNLNDVINNNLATQETAAKAITKIYGSLESFLSGLGFSITPKQVAEMLSEDNYKEVAAALQVERWDDVALVVKNGDEIYDITNMGFENGDMDGFINCLTAALRPVIREIANAGLLTNKTAEDGSVSYGLYETVIIPTFEALGIKPAADSVTYTDNYTKLSKKADKSAAYDYLVKTVLSPVLDLLNQLAASPAATLLNLLPNLAYAVQYNPQLAFVGTLLAGENGKIDLTGLLNGLIQGIQTGTDDAGNAIYGLQSFELPEISLDALASCGTVNKKMKSMSQLHAYYTNVQADKADTFVTVFYYLYDAINYKDNMDLISGLLADIDGLNPTLAGMIDTILNDVFRKSREDALCALGTLLASDVWECPDDASNNGNKTPSTGDYTLTASVFLILMAGACGSIIFLKRKKTNNNI